MCSSRRCRRCKGDGKDADLAEFCGNLRVPAETETHKKEEQVQSRIEEIIGAGVDCVATACPYCLSMFEDALKAKEAEESVRALDLAELIAASLPPVEK